MSPAALDAGANIIGRLCNWATSQTDRTYLSCADSTGKTVSVTFGDLHVRVQATAQRLRQMGVRPTDTVGLLANNDLASVVGLYAILYVGAVAHITNPDDPAARLQEQFACTTPVLVLRSEAVDAEWDAAIEIADRMSPDDTPLAPHDPLPSEPALLVGTSGSTAEPKIVVQTHENIAANAQATVSRFGMDPDFRLMGPLPINHVNAIHFTLFASMWAGSHAVLLPAFEPLALYRQMETWNPTIVSAVPSIIQAFVHVRRKPVALERLRGFVSAAAPLTAETVERAASLQVRVFQGYGLTETTNFSTMMPVDLSEDDYVELTSKLAVPSVGTAVGSNDVAVFRNGGPVPIGEEGEVCMRGPSVMPGYLDNPVANRASFYGEWFRSGDIGRLERRKSGDFLILTGRLKNIAKIAGDGIALEQIERAICSLEGVQDAGCSTVSDHLLGQRIIAGVVFEGHPCDVRAALGSQLRASFIPTSVVPLTEIPRSATGKIQRDSLARALRASSESTRQA